MHLIPFRASHQWLVLIASFFLSLSAFAGSDTHWQTIGSTHITASSEMTTIQIHPKAKDTIWKSIKLRISKGDVKVRKLKLLMSDNQVVMLDVQKLIKAGLSSRVLKVPDRGRTIKKVTVFYQSPGDHSADITLMAAETLSQSL